MHDERSGVGEATAITMLLSLQAGELDVGMYIYRRIKFKCVHEFSAAADTPQRPSGLLDMRRNLVQKRHKQEK